MFVSSHLMSEMQLTVDRPIVIGRGKLLADAPVDEFIAGYSRTSVSVRVPVPDALRALGATTESDRDELIVHDLSVSRVGDLVHELGIRVHGGRGVKALVAVVMVIVGLLGVPAAASPRLSLPDPGGPYPIGLRTLHLTDQHRADLWAPERRRELMVSVWYPAVPVGGQAQYMTPAESAAAIAGRKLDLPPDTLSKIQVHARENAPSLPGRRPLVLLSPGAGNSRTTLTSVAERLAAQGFVVAGIDHAYEAWETEFPDGLRQCIPCGLPGEPWPDAIANRALDVSFVIDTLLRDRRWSLDPAKIGMAGHSAVGSATAAAMAADPRIKAGVNVDGPFAGMAVSAPLIPAPDSSFGDVVTTAAGMGGYFALLGSRTHLRWRRALRTLGRHRALPCVGRGRPRDRVGRAAAPRRLRRKQGTFATACVSDLGVEPVFGF